MELVTSSLQGDKLTLTVSGRVDSQSAPKFEQLVMASMKDAQISTVTMNCNDLTYISSAGLRVLLKIKKAIPHFTLAQVTETIFEVLEVTGFCDILDVQRKG